MNVVAGLPGLPGTNNVGGKYSFLFAFHDFTVSVQICNRHNVIEQNRSEIFIRSFTLP